jgi:hypothetical protein
MPGFDKVRRPRCGMSPGALLQGALHGPGVVGACLTLVREKHFELAAPVFP